MRVGHLADDAFRAVELLQQEHAGQFVGEGHAAEADQLPGTLAHGLVQTVGAADDEAGTAHGVVVDLLQQLGQLGRGHGDAALVQHQGHVLRAQGLQQAAAFQLVALGLGQGGVPVPDFHTFQTPPAVDALAVVGGGVFPERYFQFAHTEQAQGFPCHDSSIVVSDIHGGRRRPQIA